MALAKNEYDKEKSYVAPEFGTIKMCIRDSIRKGKNAPNTEPIVIYQKLRFLDEDLGRIASLYELQ